MKVAFILPSLANKGPIIVARNIVEYIVSQGIECQVFYFDAICELQFACPTAQIKLTDWRAVTGYHIMHSHGIRPDLYSFLNPNRKIRRVSTIHCYIRNDLEMSLGYSKIKSKVFEFIWNIFLTRMDRIVVLSKHAETYYKRLLFNHSITAVYNGVKVNNRVEEPDSDMKQLIELKSKGKKIIGTAAVLTQRKGLHQIINILPRFPQLYFCIIGDGPARQQLETDAEKLNVAERCLFLGYKKNALDYFSYFDCFAIPSYSEGVPLALLETAALAIPAVVSDIPIFRELYRATEVAFAKLDDPDSMQSAIEYILDNRVQLGKNIYRRYIDNYTTEAMGENYLKIYREQLK